MVLRTSLENTSVSFSQSLNLSISRVNGCPSSTLVNDLDFHTNSSLFITARQPVLYHFCMLLKNEGKEAWREIILK